jgi:hypothetical protein
VVVVEVGHDFMVVLIGFFRCLDPWVWDVDHGAWKVCSTAQCGIRGNVDT